MSIRIAIAGLVFVILQVALLGIGALAVLTTPLSVHAPQMLPPLVLATIFIALAAAWVVSPKLCVKYWTSLHQPI